MQMYDDFEQVYYLQGSLKGTQITVNGCAPIIIKQKMPIETKGIFCENKFLL